MQACAWRHGKPGLVICAMALMIGAAAMSSCVLRPKGDGAPQGGGGGGRAARDNPFAPARIEVHPLTRLVRDPQTGMLRIEAHIALLDRWGDEVKGRGLLLLEVYRDTGSVAGVGAAQQLAHWNVDLSDLRANAESYDRVTRTYRVTLTGLGVEADRAGAHLELRAQLTTPDGRRLSASYRLGGP